MSDLVTLPSATPAVTPTRPRVRTRKSHQRDGHTSRQRCHWCRCVARFVAFILVLVKFSDSDPVVGCCWLTGWIHRCQLPRYACLVHQFTWPRKRPASRLPRPKAVWNRSDIVWSMATWNKVALLRWKENIWFGLRLKSSRELLLTGYKKNVK